MKRLNTYINEWKINDKSIENIDQLKYFIYNNESVLEGDIQIKLFGTNWYEHHKYEDKIYINGEHVEIDAYHGRTIKEYPQGIYRVYIKDIDNVTDCTQMFENSDIVSIPLFNISKVKSMFKMFYGCDKLTSVPKFDTRNAMTMNMMFKFCDNLKEVPLFNNPNAIAMVDMFANCEKLSKKTIQQWSKIYDFNLHQRIQ